VLSRIGCSTERENSGQPYCWALCGLNGRKMAAMSLKAALTRVLTAMSVQTTWSKTTIRWGTDVEGADAAKVTSKSSGWATGTAAAAPSSKPNGRQRLHSNVKWPALNHPRAHSG
jgi:hypothetical protein